MRDPEWLRQRTVEALSWLLWGDQAAVLSRQKRPPNSHTHSGIVAPSDCAHTKMLSPAGSCEDGEEGVEAAWTAAGSWAGGEQTNAERAAV